MLRSRSTFMERNSSQVSCSRRNSWLTCRMPKHRSYMADWRMRSLQEEERRLEERSCCQVLLFLPVRQRHSAITHLFMRSMTKSFPSGHSSRSPSARWNQIFTEREAVQQVRAPGRIANPPPPPPPHSDRRRAACSIAAQTKRFSCERPRGTSQSP